MYRGETVLWGQNFVQTIFLNDEVYRKNESNSSFLRKGYDLTEKNDRRSDNWRRNMEFHRV